MPLKKSLSRITLLALPGLLLGGAALATGACGGVVDVPTDVPTCITQIIDDAKAGSPVEHPTAVTEFEYKGKLVYLLSPQCCDQFDTLLDAQCTTICAPSGGISGGGDGKCTDFDTAKKTRTLWTEN